MKSSGESIGEAAARFGLDTHVLRFWEDEGLLRPTRDGAGRRLFSQDDVVRVAVILRNKAAGMSLEQIRVLLDEGRPIGIGCSRSTSPSSTGAPPTSPRRAR